jgi:hypothetical protein
MSAALDLKGVAGHLGVNYWRARRWRRNSISGSGDRRLPDPDVLAMPPRWSTTGIEGWAKGEGLWPPKADQYVCAECGRTGSVYTDDEMIMRDHGWTTVGDQMIACPGSGMRAKGRALTGAAA